MLFGKRHEVEVNNISEPGEGFGDAVKQVFRSEVAPVPARNLALQAIETELRRLVPNVRSTFEGIAGLRHSS
jgi:hypothetical protein